VLALWDRGVLRAVRTPVLCPRFAHASHVNNIQTDVDVVIGYNSDEIVSTMRVTETLRTLEGKEAKHAPVSGAVVPALPTRPLHSGAPQFRRILVDWMCEAGEVFRLQKCTVHVAVGYMDRILEEVAVAKNRLQLVAMCCLIIAST